MLRGSLSAPCFPWRPFQTNDDPEEALAPPPAAAGSPPGVALLSAIFRLCSKPFLYSTESMTVLLYSSMSNASWEKSYALPLRCSILSSSSFSLPSRNSAWAIFSKWLTARVA